MTEQVAQRHNSISFPIDLLKVARGEVAGPTDEKLGRSTGERLPTAAILDDLRLRPASL